MREIYHCQEKNDMILVEFFVNAPSKYDLFFHRDWKQMFGNSLIEDIKFKYNDINFLEIANASEINSLGILKINYQVK